MRRIRVVFILLAAVLLGPMALVVRGALQSADYEHHSRHRALAERAGDELERELSRLVRQEEARPFGHYRFYHVPPNVAGGRFGLTRSPLARRPRLAYVIGYFEIQPDGSVRTPLVPREPELARDRGDWRPEEGADVVARMQSIVEAAFGAADATAPGIPDELRGEPGSTRPLTPAIPERAPPVLAPVDRPPPDAYHALLALNRGAAERAEGAPLHLRLHFSRLEDGSGLRVLALGGGDEPLAESALRFVQAGGRPEIWFDPADVLRDEVPREKAVQLHPLTGQLAGSEHLILMRGALLEGDWYLQGMVLDVSALIRWLDRSVFRESELARQLRRDYTVLGGPPPPPLDDGTVAFVHRFAEPFDALTVRMAMPPMAGGSGSYVKLLALLVLVIGSAGLYALYRMVEVTVRFAERRSNFVAAVTHELKTPLTAIRMYGEMLRDGMVDSEEKRREYAGTITAESERLSRLVHNVLEFSRLEQGTRDVDLVTGPLGPVVEEAARLLLPHARAASFVLQVEIAEGLPPVRYDRDAVLQVVFNLVDNAFKYARDAEDRRVVLRLARAESGVRLAVRDRGPGVPAEHLSRIFEAFYRGEEELTRTTKGTGIGLALVRGLAERMGAAVSGRNASGGGFEVTVRFAAA